MKKILGLFAIGLFACQQASAEPYISGNVLWANGAEPSGNIGGAIAAGMKNGWVRAEIEASNHMHLSNGTLGVSAKGYIEPDWKLSPYLGIGAGYSFEDTLILTATVGAAYKLTEAVNLTAGYEHRWYGPVAEFGDSEDGYGTLGIRKSF